MGPYSVIGDRTSVGQGCCIEGIVGSDCRIQNNVNIFSGVIIHSDVFIGPNVTFTNVKKPEPGVKQEHVGTLVRSGAVIGAGSTILCGITIGSNAFIGAGSVVTKNVPDNEVWYGNPARRQNAEES